MLDDEPEVPYAGDDASSLDELMQSFDTAATAATDKKAQADAAKPVTLSAIWAKLAHRFEKDGAFKVLRDHTGSFDAVTISANDGVDRITVVANKDNTFNVGDIKNTSSTATLALLGDFYGTHKKKKDLAP